MPFVVGVIHGVGTSQRGVGVVVSVIVGCLLFEATSVQFLLERVKHLELQIQVVVGVLVIQEMQKHMVEQALELYTIQMQHK